MPCSSEDPPRTTLGTACLRTTTTSSTTCATGSTSSWTRAANPALQEAFDEARDAAESRATVALLDEALAQATRTPSQQALARLRAAYRGTRMTQAELASHLGTSRSRLNSYLTGKVTPSMDVLVAVEKIADEYRAPSRAHNLVLI